MIASQITARLAEIAATITTANGYASNVGALVVIGDGQSVSDTAPSLSVIPGRQQTVDFYRTDEIERDYVVKAFADLRHHPGTEEYELVDIVIWDLRKAFSAYDSTLYGLGCEVMLKDDRPGYSESGGAIVGAALALTINYRVDPSDPTSTP